MPTPTGHRSFSCTRTAVHTRFNSNCATTTEGRLDIDLDLDLDSVALVGREAERRRAVPVHELGRGSGVRRREDFVKVLADNARM